MDINSQERLHNVFFYGLYMDPEILEQKGVIPRNPQVGIAEGYELRIGNKATLLRSSKKSASGMVYSLTHKEIDSLYWGAGLDEYAAEAIFVKVGNETIPALCCNLITPPEEGESNPDYGCKLKIAMNRLGLE
jgi:hypothetical protein